MTTDTRIALFLMGELVAALRANDPDLFKRWLTGRQVLKLAFVRFACISNAPALCIHDSQTKEPAVHADSYRALDPVSGQHSENHHIFWNQGLAGVTVLLGNHPAYKARRTKPERGSRNNPNFQEGQFAESLLRHG